MLPVGLSLPTSLVPLFVRMKITTIRPILTTMFKNIYRTFETEILEIFLNHESTFSLSNKSPYEKECIT